MHILEAGVGAAFGIISLQSAVYKYVSWMRFLECAGVAAYKLDAKTCSEPPGDMSSSYFFGGLISPSKNRD